MASTNRRAAEDTSPPPRPDADERPRRPRLRRLTAAVLVAASAAIAAGALLSLYAGDPRSLPAGADTPWYVWRARVVAAEGMRSLADSIPETYTEVARVQAFRIGYPVLAGFLRSLAGIRPFDLAYALPAIVAAVVAVGAGAYAVQGLREPRWAYAVHAVLVGTSVNVVLTSVSHADNLIVLGLLVTAAALALMAAQGRATIVPAALVLGAAALVHWSFTALFAALVGVLAVALLPGSVRRVRGGAPAASTASARLGLVVAGGAATAVAGHALAPASPSMPRGWQRNIVPKLGRDVPRIGALGPPALIGAVALMAPRDRGRRRGLLLTVLWAAVALAGVGLITVVEVPGHRLLHFSLGVPILAAAGITGAARLVAGRGGFGLRVVLASVVAVALVSAGVILGLGAWRPFLEARVAQVEQAAVAGRYLSAVGGSRPAVFLVELRSGRTPVNVIRMALPVEEIRRTYLYFGSLEGLRRGQPTSIPGRPEFNRLSRQYWSALRPALDREPIVLALSSLAPEGTPQPAGTELAPGVTVVRGPPPPSEMGPVADAPRPPGMGTLIAVTAAALAVLWVVGLGWAGALVPAGWATRASVAPALGASILVLGGVVGGRAGVDGDAGRIVIAAVLAVGGWAWAAARARRVSRAGGIC